MPLATWMYFFINAIDTYLSLKKHNSKNNITGGKYITVFVIVAIFVPCQGHN